MPVLQIIEATRPWTRVSASSAKKTPARNSCVQQTVPIDLKEPDIKLSLKRYNRSMTLIVCRRMYSSLAWTMVMDWSKH